MNNRKKRKNLLECLSMLGLFNSDYTCRVRYTPTKSEIWVLKIRYNNQYNYKYRITCKTK